MNEHQHPPGHALDCKLSLGGKFCTCGYHKRKNKSIPCPRCGGRLLHEDGCPYGKMEQKKKATKTERLIDIKQKMDGVTWMVSVISPGHTNGSAWYSERAGKTPEEAARSYMKDSTDDNPGADAIKKFPDEVLICVIDQALAPSGKQWHVHLFCIEDGDIQRFPG